jgi:hypothetical protein
LAVGDSTRLEIVFNTGGYSNVITKSPIIRTNEGLPDKSVRIKTNVLIKPDSTYPIVIKPFRLQFTEIGDSLPTEVHFTITNVSRQAVAPSLVSSPRPLLSVVLPKSIPAGKSAKAIIKLKKDGLTISLDKSITIQLDDAAKTRFTIPVRVSLAAKIIPWVRPLESGH